MSNSYRRRLDEIQQLETIIRELEYVARHMAITGIVPSQKFKSPRVDEFVGKRLRPLKRLPWYRRIFSRSQS